MQPDDLVRVYSYQTPKIWEDAQKLGYMAGHEDYIGEGRGRDYGEPFWRPYEWMREQMAERIPDFSGDYPVWAWPVRQNERRKKYRKEETLRVVALIPRKRILFSDFDLWHCVLNSNAVSYTEEEYDEWGRKWPAHYTTYSPEQEEAYFQDIMKTWPLIFDLDDSGWDDRKQIEWRGRPDMVQLCIDRIYLAEIVSVRFFDKEKS